MYFAESDGLSLIKNLPDPDGTWELLEVIGGGNYGEVFKGRNCKNGEIAAVKIMEAVLDKEEDIRSELNVFENHCNHPNIVKFFGAFVKRDKREDDQLWIVMEYCSGGSVTNLVKNMNDKGMLLPEDLIAYILREVTQGLVYLHKAHVMHRDIKGQNVLLTRQAHIRLVDFGVSAMVERTTGRRNTSIGTPYWMAPEVIACENQVYEYDMRADVWSLGITNIEVADGTPPLYGQHPMKALLSIPRSPPPTLKNPEKWTKNLNDFIAKCLIKDYETRPTSSELLQLPLVKRVPENTRPLRRKLMTLIDLYNTGSNEQVLSDGTGSSEDRETIKRSRQLQHKAVVNDLTTLEYIDENIIAAQLKERYLNGIIYTYVGDILVSINPFHEMPELYSDEVTMKYINMPRGHSDPHIFAIADGAYQGMISENRNQCIVISGESGAGKTEASNFVVQQLMKLGKAKTRTLEDQILQVNPLLESFGNARTVINNNSSRFGKYLELLFTPSGHVVGAKLSEYLLEKSRVVMQPRKEKNFHVFYYLLAGLTYRNALGKYQLRPMQQHRYLGHGGTSTQKRVKFYDKFLTIERCFHVIGFTPQEVESMYNILAAILHIGDIKLEADVSEPHAGESTRISNMEVLTYAANLLGVKAQRIANALTSSNVITSGETIIRPVSIEKAVDFRDAMAKVLYGRLFSWIVRKINIILEPSVERDQLHSVGVLDIFGFENCKNNSFEQLCINIANEQLQFYFNQNVFTWEQEEYEREGIEVDLVNYEDNRPRLDVFLNRPMGMLALLDEESRFPKATDRSLADKFHDHFSNTPYYTPPKDGGPCFTFTHYAGAVTYETAGFLEKNRDTLQSDVVNLLKHSHDNLVRELFVSSHTSDHVTTTETGSPKKIKKPSATPLFSRRAPQAGLASSQQNKSKTPLSSSGTLTARKSRTVGAYFVYSLRDLVSQMLAGTPHFVRCIRPNDLRSRNHFQLDKVIIQLRYTGVIETTFIRKQGYSHRIPFDVFVDRYKIISFKFSQSVESNPTNCIQVLMQAGLEGWKMGQTKVFLKYYHVERLTQILNTYHKAARLIQNAMISWFAQRKLMEKKREEIIIKLQALLRGWLVRRHHQQQKAVIIRFQAAVRGLLARQKFAAEKYVQARRTQRIIQLQAEIRKYLAQKKYKILKKQHEQKIQQEKQKRLEQLRGLEEQKKLAQQRELERQREMEQLKQHRDQQQKEQIIISLQAAIRGKMARDEAKRIKEKTLKSDNKFTNKKSHGNGSMRLRLHRSVMSSVKLLETKMKKAETMRMEKNIVMFQSAMRGNLARGRFKDLKARSLAEEKSVEMLCSQVHSSSLQCSRFQISTCMAIKSATPPKHSRTHDQFREDNEVEGGLSPNKNQDTRKQRNTNKPSRTAVHGQSIIQSTKRHYEQLVAEQSCKQVHRPIAKKNNGPHRKHSPRELFGEGVHSFFNFKQVLEKFNNKDNNRTAILSHSKPIV